MDDSGFVARAHEARWREGDHLVTSHVSAALLAELANAVRRHGLVAWLDRHGHYTAFVDELIRQHHAGELAFPVLAYRGSFLELMLGLERYGNGLDRDALLIHLPGYETHNVRHTPVLEQYEAAHPFRKALETLVVEAAAGRVGPEEIKRFAATPGLTLAQADAWLAGHTSGPRTGVGQRLAALDPKQLVDGLLGEDRALLRELGPQDVPELAAHLERTVGLDAAWRGFFGVEANSGAARELESLVTALAGWVLSVEFVHDLKREPHTPELRPLKRLPKPFVEQSVALARHFRERHPKTYAPAADETEQRIPADALGSHASELGKVDTFRFEEERIREAAVAAAREGRWGEALAWAEQREGVAFWLDASPPKRWTWDLVLYAAKLGVAIEATGGLVGPRATLADAVLAYTERGHLVDLAHRRFEQRHHDIMSGDVHGRDGLLAVIHAARRAYRDWADELARAFSRACQANGYLPDESLQQRTIYDRVVAPLVSGGGRAAVFLVDAFRYEMAAELKRELEGPGVNVDLKVALAELPTVTSVGMNVLAAVNQGQRLVPVLSDGDIDGFRTNEFQVRTRDNRARAMGDRADRKAPRQLDLETINRLSSAELRAIVARAPALIVVHSRELDDGGEAGFGAATFERSLRQLRAAWNQLSQAGVKQFVFLADHGFLLQDSTAREEPYGRRTDPSRRHVIEEHARSEPGMVSVPMSSLRYELPQERYLLMREDTAVWKTTARGASFVHGGNSLQERVVPVLVVRRKQSAGAADTEYEVRAEALEDRHGRRRVRLQLRLAPNAVGTLAFTGASYVTLGLRAKDRPEVGVTITDVDGGAQLDAGTLRVPVRADWSTVYFMLEAPTAGPAVQVEVFHPDGREKVVPCTLAAWFDVDAPPPRERPEPPTEPAPVVPAAAVAAADAAPTPYRRAPASPPAAPKMDSARWQEGIEDEGYRGVFVHIETYGAVTEADLETLLGNPRRVRAFSRHFDELVVRVPFRVRIETTGVMKTYVKESR